MERPNRGEYLGQVDADEGERVGEDTKEKGEAENADTGAIPVRNHRFLSQGSCLLGEGGGLTARASPAGDQCTSQLLMVPNVVPGSCKRLLV